MVSVCAVMFQKNVIFCLYYYLNPSENLKKIIITSDVQTKCIVRIKTD